MASRVLKMQRMIQEIYECFPLDTYLALRSSNRFLRDALPQFGTCYIIISQICRRLWSLLPKYEHERDHQLLPMRFLVLRMLLRWSDPDDGCGSLIALYSGLLDHLLAKTETSGLRSEGVALMRELSLRVSSVWLLLVKRHVEAKRELRELLYSTSTESSSGWRLSSLQSGSWILC